MYISFFNMTGSSFPDTTQALCDAIFCQGGGGGKRWRSAASGLVMVFQVGRSVHIVADAIHTYATEVHPEYKQQVPVDMMELIHFLDEDLGHWLLFIPYYSLLALLTYCHAGAANAVHALCCGLSPGNNAPFGTLRHFENDLTCTSYVYFTGPTSPARLDRRKSTDGNKVVGKKASERSRGRSRSASPVNTHEKRKRGISGKRLRPIKLPSLSPPHLSLSDQLLKHT